MKTAVVTLAKPPHNLIDEALLQGMLGGNLEQTRNLFAEMQEQMQRQTEQLLGTFGVKR